MMSEIQKMHDMDTREQGDKSQLCVIAVWVYVFLHRYIKLLVTPICIILISINILGRGIK